MLLCEDVTKSIAYFRQASKQMNLFPSSRLLLKLSLSFRSFSTWYVGVSPGNFTESGNGGLKYGIWFGTSCPSFCASERGVCGEKEETGVCRCRYGWKGLSCEEGVENTRYSD